MSFPNFHLQTHESGGNLGLIREAVVVSLVDPLLVTLDMVEIQLLDIQDNPLQLLDTPDRTRQLSEVRLVQLVTPERITLIRPL